MGERRRQQEAAEGADERARDLAYIKDPFRWVAMLCPLKRFNGRDREYAYMIGDGPNIYHGNMFMPKSDDRKEEYAGYEAIIEAGWVVD